MTETDLMHAVMLAVTEAGNQIFRTNVGKVRTPDGRYLIQGCLKAIAIYTDFGPTAKYFTSKRNCIHVNRPKSSVNLS